MKSSTGSDSLRLKTALGRLGEILFFMAVVAFGAVSFGTSFSGLKTLLAILWAGVAAFALQGSLIGASILLARARLLRERLLLLVASILTACISIFFSYIGIRAVLVRQVAEVRAPLIERQRLSDEEARLQQAATSLRGRALARLENDHATTFASYKVASASRGARELEARQYEDELHGIRTDLNELKVDTTLTAKERTARFAALQEQEQRDLRLLKVARAASGKLQLDAEEGRISSNNISNVRNKLIAYLPDFFAAKDWRGLTNRYDRLAAVWDLLPLNFQTSNPLPKPPTESILVNGLPPSGFDQPVVEAARSIENLHKPSDIFALMLAFLFDGIPLISIFATAGVNHRFPDRLAHLRRWMEATTLQIQMMPGILPWLVYSVRDFFWTPSTKTDDPRIAAFESTLNQLKGEMDDFLEGLSDSPSAFEGISVQMASLFSRANVIAFDSAEKLKNLAMRMYRIFSDAVASSTLSDADKEKAREFVASQSERFTSAVDDAFAD